ncbi:MAG: L,D-transpeptidase family protein [Dorea sp.]|nr:L,D-transpeptidase family protein [Dorea sp.]
MHNMKKLLLVSACCISMVFPGTALAAEVADAPTPVVEATIEDSAIVADNAETDVITPEINTEANTENQKTLQPEETIVPEEPETETEEAYTGLKEEDGNLYYYDGGEKVTNKILKAEDGFWYYFQEDGTAYKTTGTLVTAPNGKRYTFNANGQAYTSVVKKVEGAFYYFSQNGYQFSRLGEVRKVNGYYYTFNEDGTIMTDAPAVQVGNYIYYFGPSGKAVVNKLKTIKGSKYYFTEKGRAATSWKYVDEKLYCFGSDGKALTGFQKKGSTWCYIDKKTCVVKYRDNVLYNSYKKIKSSKSQTSYYITVDTTANRCIVWTGSANKWEPLKVWKCSPGKSSTPTVTGYFKTAAKGYSFGGSDYTCYYYTQFYGDYLFHSVLYHKNSMNIKDGRLGMNLSHGCVRLHIEHAKWIYDNIPTNTQVYIWR